MSKNKKTSRMTDTKEFKEMFNLGVEGYDVLLEIATLNETRLSLEKEMKELKEKGIVANKEEIERLDKKINDIIIETIPKAILWESKMKKMWGLYSKLKS